MGKRWSFRLCLALSAANAAVCIPQLPAQAALSFTSQNSSNFLDGADRMLGWEFSVNANLSVSGFGWFDWSGDGLAFSHEVGLWDTSGSTLLASATIPAGTAAALSNSFRTISLGSNVALLTGHTYRLAGFDPGSGDPHVWDAALGGFPNVEVNGFSRDSRVDLVSGGAIGFGVGSFVFPASVIGDSRGALMGPNFIIAVPEPEMVSATIGIASLLATMARRRKPRACGQADGPRME